MLIHNDPASFKTGSADVTFEIKGLRHFFLAVGPGLVALRAGRPDGQGERAWDGGC